MRNDEGVICHVHDDLSQMFCFPADFAVTDLLHGLQYDIQYTIECAALDLMLQFTITLKNSRVIFALKYEGKGKLRPKKV